MNADNQLASAATSIRIFPDGRMSVRDACAYTGLSYKSLATQRSAGIGPPFIRLGRAVFYRKDDLDEWLASCRVRSVAEYRARNKRGAA